MATVTLRPDGVASNVGWLLVAGASIQVALSDNLDANYIKDNVAAGDTAALVLNFGTSAIPAGAYVKSITPRIRWKGEDILSVSVQSALTTSPFYKAAFSGMVGGLLVFTTQTGGSSPSVFTNIQNEVDNIQLALNNTPSGAVGIGICQIAEVYLDVVYNVAPVTSAVTVTNQTVVVTPTVSWTYADTELDTQERYQVKAFTAAQYGAGGFDPETSTAAWVSGETYSGASSMVIGADLAVGTTYKAYVKTADTGSNGRYSAWVASIAFIPNVDLPLAPVIVSTTAVALTANINIALTSAANLMSSDDASLEVAIGTWINNANATLVRDTVTAAVNGTATLKATSIAAGDMSAKTGQGVAGDQVLAGITYTARAQGRPAVTARNIRLDIQWFNAAGALLSTTTGASTATVAATYTPLVTIAAAPALATFAALLVTTIATAAASEVTNWDQMGLAPGNGVAWSRGDIATAQTFKLQRSYDAGATWESVPLCSSISLPATTQTATFSDYTSKPNTAVVYRAQVTSVVGTISLTSVWSATSSSATSVITAFWLKNPANATQNITINIAGDFDLESEETQGLFKPLGRTRAIVVSGDIYGEAFDLPIALYTEASWLAIEVIRGAQVTLLLQSDMTKQWWVRLGPVRRARLVNRADRKLTPYRQVQVSAVEVDSV